ncbi:MAG: ABC transporter ATP-binding protein, partial [Allorhizobium sp.]
LVFQNYALFPHMTVAENVGFGLKMRKVPKVEVAGRIAEALESVHLSGYAERYPRELSGGQQQRVALARAIAPRPSVLLLDEPLSNLDLKLREAMRIELKEIQAALGMTFVYVTHDQEEALSISDRIVVMNAGKADQIGTPFEIYNRPTTRFVASFVGTLNVLDAVVADQGAGLVKIGDKMLTIKEAISSANGQTIQLAMRPEAGTLSGADEATVHGQVTSSQFLGSVIRTRIDVAGKTLSFDTFNDPGIKPPVVGDTVGVKIDPSALIVLAD